MYAVLPQVFSKIAMLAAASMLSRAQDCTGSSTARKFHGTFPRDSVSRKWELSSELMSTVQVPESECGTGSTFHENYPLALFVSSRAFPASIALY